MLRESLFTYMQKLLFIIVMTVSFGFLYSQDSNNKYQDSLLLELKYATSDVKAEKSLAFIKEFYKEIPDKSIEIIDETLESASITLLDRVELLYYKGLASYYQSNFKNFSKFSKESFAILDKYQGDLTPRYHSLKYLQINLEAIRIRHQGQPNEALEQYLKGYQHAVKSEDQSVVSKSLQAIGSFYIDQKDHHKGITYLKQCLELNTSENNSSSVKVSLHSVLASSYVELKKLDSAKYYLDLIPTEKYSFPILSTFAAYHHQNGQPTKALHLIDSLITVVESNGPRHWLPFFKQLKADNLYTINEYTSAEKNWIEARLLFIELNDNEGMISVTESLFDYYKKRGNFEKALIYHEEFKMLSDTALYTSHNKVIKGLEDSHQLKITAQENQQLKQDRLLQTITIQRQRLTVLLSALLISGLTLLLLYFFRRAKRRKKAADQLKASHSDLEIRNEEQRSNAKRTLDSKNRELATKMMQISKRSNELKEIQTNLQDLYKDSNSSVKMKVSKIIKKVTNAVDIEDGWETFNLYFNEIHPSFIHGLKNNSSELSNNELRHCTFVKLGLSNKEVAEMLNVTSKSVEVAKYRIKKKLSLTKEQSLTEYLSQL